MNDNFNFGTQIWYSPSVLNSGAPGIYYTGNVTLTAPTEWFTNGLGAYVSGDIGYWDLGRSDAFYGIAGTAFATGVPYKSYWNWDAGIAFTWRAITLDLRYYGTNLNKANCNVFTSDQNASGTTNVTPTNPGGLGPTGAARLISRSFRLPPPLTRSNNGAGSGIAGGEGIRSLFAAMPAPALASLRRGDRREQRFQVARRGSITMFPYLRRAREARADSRRRFF